ncbi:MAG: HAD hydrolase family protein [Pseudomonadota bacterium]
MTTAVFTDLDGTLLDHTSYDYAPALPAIAALRAAGIPLVLASSKTSPEMAVLHAELGLGGLPYISENGAGIVGGPGTPEPPCYQDIRAALAALPPALRAAFTGFGDMDAGAVATLTGLDAAAAARAKARSYSEPGTWNGDAAGLRAFTKAMAQAGFAAQHGGRFLTLSRGRTKADAMRQVAADLGARHVVALGDAPNDIAMLEAADLGVIVRNPHGTPLGSMPGEAAGRIRRSQLDGPAGWNQAVIEIVDEITNQKAMP